MRSSKIKIVITSLTILTIIVFNCYSESQENNNDNFQQAKRKRHQKRRCNLKRFPKLQAMFNAMSEEEQTKLKQLHKNNPNEFRQEMKKRIQAWKKQQRCKNKSYKQIKALQKSYLKTKDKEEKSKIFTQLKTAIEKEFDTRMIRNKERLEQLEERLKSLRKKYELRKQNRDKIVEKHLEKLTQSPDLSW